MKPNKILFGILILIIFTIIACSPVPEQEEIDPIKIGVIAPLTGDGSSYGLAAKEGLDFAVIEINKEGGVLGRELQLIYEDSELDPKKAVSIMNKFVNINNFKIVIVADGSGPTTAVAPMADQTETLVIATLASTPQLSEMGDHVFRTVPSDAYQGVKLAEFAESKDFKTSAILYVNDAYGVGIKDVFSKEFSGEVLAVEAFDSGATDFRTQLTKIKNKNPDVILIVARNELPGLLKQIDNLDIKSELIASETAKNDELIQISGQSAEWLYTVFFTEPTDDKDYKEKFIQEYGKEPAGYSDYSYDAIYVLSEAITRAGELDNQKIKNELYKTRFYGATGILEFDSNGDVTNKPMTMYRVINGKFASVSS